MKCLTFHGVMIPDYVLVRELKCNYVSYVSIFQIGQISYVNTLSGRVVGKKRATPTGTTFYAYKGIPYAEPPVNNLRFQVINTLYDFLNLKVSSYSFY